MPEGVSGGKIRQRYTPLQLSAQTEGGVSHRQGRAMPVLLASAPCGALVRWVLLRSPAGARVEVGA